MPVDFRELLRRSVTPERWLEILAGEERFKEDQRHFRAMDDDTICNTLEYYMTQCEQIQRWMPGQPVYDAVVWHVIIPELLRRIRKGGSK